MYGRGSSCGGGVCASLVAAALLAVGGGNGTRQPAGPHVAAADAGRPEVVLQLGHSLAPHSAVYSADGKTLVTAARDGTLRIWDPGAGELRQVLVDENFATSLACTPDGNTLVVGNLDPSVVSLWDVRRLEVARKLAGHQAAVHSVAVSPDGRWIASGAADQTVRIWDARTGAAGHVIRDESLSIHSVAFSPDGRLLAGGTDSGALRLWDAASGRLLLTFTALPPAGPGSKQPEWLCTTPEGYYDASPGAASLIRWRSRDRLLPVTAYEANYHRPDLVRKAIVSHPGAGQQATAAPAASFGARARRGE